MLDDIYTSLSNNRDLTAEQLDFFLGRDGITQPLKPLYAGNETITSKNGRKIKTLMYVKSSSFPLLPQMTRQFSDMDNLRRNIEKLENEKKLNVRVSYQSANKVGSLPNGINIDRLFNNLTSPEGMAEMFRYTRELNRDNFYIQQDSPSHYEDSLETGKDVEINVASQPERILFADGTNFIKEKIFENLFDSELIEEYNLAKLTPPINNTVYKRIG